MTKRRSLAAAIALGWLKNAACAVLLVLLGVGYAVPALHFSLVEHEICPEDGLIRHVERVTSPKLSVARGSNHESRILAGPRLEHEHDHCSFLTTPSTEQPRPPAQDLAVARRALAREATPLTESHAQRGLCVLDYAPKLAPPV